MTGKMNSNCMKNNCCREKDRNHMFHWLCWEK